jgi:negative regulator of sigma E activity
MHSPRAYTYRPAYDRDTPRQQNQAYESPRELQAQHQVYEVQLRNVSDNKNAFRPLLWFG